MLTLFFQKAFQDILNNRFLNSITIITIGLSVLIVSSFTLFFINANSLLDSWKKGIRVLVYLKPETSEANRLDLRYKIQQLADVQDLLFISKEEALNSLKLQMKRHASLFDNLRTNPLPDAFEIHIKDASKTMKKVEALANKIESFSQVDDVEYGQHWIGRFVNIISIFKFAGYGMGSLFMIATLFIVANTIRLVFYARKEEIEIMRLVGATDRFIKAPFYIEGIILSVLGWIVGLISLFAAYQLVLSKFHQNLSAGMLEVKFLSISQFIVILFSTLLVGWIGCSLSLKQFLRK